MRPSPKTARSPARRRRRPRRSGRGAGRRSGGSRCRRSCRSVSACAVMRRPRRGRGPRAGGADARSAPAAARARRPRRGPRRRRRTRRRPGRGDVDEERPPRRRRASSPRAVSRSASGSAASSVSTSSWPVRSVKLVSGAVRSSRPASIATSQPATRSISPSRWLATTTVIPKSRPMRSISAEHLVAPGRVEAVRRLVQEEEARVVDERLGELDALLHAGRVAADRPIALLVEADVAEDVGRPLPRRAGGQPRDAGHVAHELGGADVRRQAVVLGHVADQLADPRALGRGVEVEDGGLALGRRRAGRAGS